MKMLLMVLCCVCVCGSAFAARIQNVEICLPYSSAKWEKVVSPKSCEEEGDEDEENGQVTILFHRNEDALEFLSVYVTEPSFFDEDDDDDDDTEWLENFFPGTTKSFCLRGSILQESDDHKLTEYALYGGAQGLGYAIGREILTDDHRTEILYLTTAEKTELNRSLWLSILNQAQVLE